MPIDPREEALIDQVFAVLEDGPCPLDEIVELLAEGGYLDHWGGDDFVDLADQLDELLAHYDGVHQTGDDVLALSDTLPVGRVFTHRITAEDLERQMIDVQPDLDALDGGSPEPLRLVGGEILDKAFAATDDGAADAGSFIGPTGWLDDFAAGDLVGLSSTADGVQLRRVDAPADGALEVAALRRAFEARVADPSVGEAELVVLLDVLVHEPAAFAAPTRPVGELLADAGLECRGEWVGIAGEAWNPPAIQNAEAERVLLAERYELDVCCLEAFDEAMLAWNELTVPTGNGVDWAQIATMLGHGSVAPAFADHVLRELDERHPVLDEFVDALRSDGGRRAAAPALYLSARNLERSGDTLAAETALQSALRADPSFDPAIEELAWYVADRGDAEQAISLLRRSGIRSDDPELQLLESMRPSRNAAGRNDPCPCGSGRKYKDCCQRNLRLPLAPRSDWLLHKVWTFTLRPHHQRHVLALAVLLGNGDDDLIDDLLDIGLPMDLAAFDDDLARAFLVERGPLLPEDERDTLASWVQQPRALWEVVEHDPGKYLALRDVAGDVVALATPPKAEFEPGALVYARLGLVGDRARFVGVPIEIDADNRSSVEALIATKPNAWAIARWFAAASYALED